MAPIRLGTRGSTLARIQAGAVADALRRRGVETELVLVETDGDRRAPDTAWGEGAFVAALERALRDGSIDAAVHSAKDMPTGTDGYLPVAAYLPRADARDALVTRDGGRGLADLPPGARVGTDSPRRTAFLRAMRPDLDVHPLHGNVDTRLRRLDSGESDALILATAGLTRLGRDGRIAERIDPAVIPPAPGQGAIAVQVRADDDVARSRVAALDDAATRTTVEAERAFLSASGGGCRAPIGALATVHGDRMTLTGAFARPDGTAVAWATVTGDAGDGEQLGRQLAQQLGARLPDVAAAMAPTERVIVTRPDGRSHTLCEALGRHGLDPVVVPAIDIEAVEPGGELDEAARRIDEYTWVVVTSVTGARAVLAAIERAGRAAQGPRWAAVGTATEGALAASGVPVSLRPRRALATELAAALDVGPGDRVLLPRADIADAALPALLRARGAHVDDVVAYRTREAPESSRPLLSAALEPVPGAIVHTSGSTVRGLLALAGSEHAETVRRIPVVVIGPRTAAEARRHGLHVAAEAASQETEALADVVAAVVRRRP